MAKGVRIVYNRLLGGWYVVTGPHQTPLNGRFNSKFEAEAWLNRNRVSSNPRRKITRAKRNPAATRFRDISIGQTFDFISPNSMMNSFYEPCVKISARGYRGIRPPNHTYRVGSINAKIYHVGKYGTINPNHEYSDL